MEITIKGEPADLRELASLALKRACEREVHAYEAEKGGYTERAGFYARRARFFSQVASDVGRQMRLAEGGA